MKLSVSAYRAHASAHKKILSSSYQTQLNYGSTAASSSTPSTTGLFSMDPPCASSVFTTDVQMTACTTTSHIAPIVGPPPLLSPTDALSPGGTGTVSLATSREEEEDSSNQTSDCKSPGNRTKSNQRWMKLRTTVQISSAIQKKPPLKREDSFLKRFSTRQIPETQETVEDTGSEGAINDHDKNARRRRRFKTPKTVVNPDENFYFYWLMALTICVLYNLWTLIVRQSFPELQDKATSFWLTCDGITDFVFVFDVIVQLRTGYLEQGLMVYDAKKLASHYVRSRAFLFDLVALTPLDFLQFRLGFQPLIRFPRFLKVYRAIKYYYIVESRTVWPNLWRVVNLIHILLILAHWFGCFYYLLSEAEGFQGDWVYPYRPGDYATLTRKYLGSLYWSTLTLTTIGDLPTPETNAEITDSADGPRSLPKRGIKSRLLQFKSSNGYVFTIVSYLIGVFIFATIVGQVGNVITNRNANRLEFERLLDGAKTYMRHHKVPGDMKRRVLRWYDYSWSRGRIQGGGDINTALGLLPDKLKTELALHVNLSVLKKVTIFQECQPEFLHDLVLKMKAYIFTPGDSICRKGEVAREMFIIADGILEVLSETGKVLTCMKAGDFFGEIGILNLDGLNKRTADVRSVGYSELFSLSREDVLAAMKDYPEAQEILQTLGRKRLMEVRCVNKRHAKVVPVNPANDQHAVLPVREGDSSDNSASKGIVSKLKSDVKGLKNVLRKSSRTTAGRRSDESIELQPLHGSSGGRTPKGLLRRMPRVKSDDMNENGDEHGRNHDKMPSPIGAGLPLLQRLRLLKEKQDREERAAKTPAPAIVSPPHSHPKSAISPQESIQEEPEHEPEVIGAGLPLLQRLKLLKAKQDREARAAHRKLSGGKIASPTITAPTVSPTSPTIRVQSPTKTTPAPPFTSPLKIKGVVHKVSFKDRIKSLQQPTAESKQQEKSISSDNSDMKQHLIPPQSPTNGGCGTGISSNPKSSSSKPSAAQAIKEKIKSFSNFEKEDSSIKPWSKLKLATVIGGSYTSLNNTLQEESHVISKTKSGSGSIMIKSNVGASNSSLNVRRSEQTSASDSEVKSTKKSKTKPRLKPLKIDSRPKMYESVDDLSPEYGGLPFVKKLKILNERQKLAELESVIQTRSFSLDCTETNAQEPIEPLYRSYSEASCMARSRTAVTTIHGVPITTNVQPCLNSPLSPESNETLERRHLKSILKKLSEDKLKEADDDHKDLKKLLQAQTLEGPPNSANIAEPVGPDRTLFPIPDAQPYITKPIATINASSEPHKQCAIVTTTHETISHHISETQYHEDQSTIGRDPAKIPFLASIPSNQKSLIKGSLEEQECFGEFILGIKQAIHSHLKEIQGRFCDKFTNLEEEIRHRDDIIGQLKSRINELENGSNTNSLVQPSRNPFREGDHRQGSSSGTGSSNELPFMRGDSLDTIFASSPPSEGDIPRPRYRTKRRLSPKARSMNCQSWESSDQDSFEGPNKSFLVSNLTGNLLPDSVIVDIGHSTSSNESQSEEEEEEIPDDEIHEREEEDDDDNDEVIYEEDMEYENEDQIHELHSNDWEVKMLAAELEKRESKTSVELCGDFDESDGLLRRRRKRSYTTDTDQSETDVDALLRPRAGSLDQVNLKKRDKTRGVFKAMSFDRDKDKL